MTTSTPEPGAARSFPAGRLAGFEDADDEPLRDAGRLGDILGPRRSNRARPVAVPAAEPTALSGPEPENAGPATSALPLSEPETSATDVDAALDVEPPADLAEPPAPAPALATASVENIGDGLRTARQPRKRALQAQPAAPAGGTPDPVGQQMRASNVHIPADFMPRVAKLRADRRLSNGELVITALEATHDRLGELIQPNATSGSLFAPRATRAVRTHDGPLTPFNIRLREADFAVIDQLVENFRAHSRGHLITVAFDAFLPTL